MKKRTVKILHLLKYIGYVLTFMLCVLLVFSAYGGHIDPHQSTISALATLGFPIVLIFSVILALAWIIVGKWRIALFVLVAILLSWPTVSIVTPLNISSHDYTLQEDSTKFKVLTFNVMNFNVMKTGDDNLNNKKGQSIVQYILDQDADVVLLQEASLAADFNDLRLIKPYLKQLKKKYPYRDHGYHDQVIWSKHPYTALEDPAIRDGFASPDDPVNSYHFYARGFDVLVPGHTVRFINVHLHSIGLSEEDRQAFVNITEGRGINTRKELQKVRYSLIGKLGEAFRKHAGQAKLLRQVLDQSDENVIICGDFNDTPASWAYRTIVGSDMNDAWVDCGFGPTYTFHNNRLFFKIDHVLYRGDMKATETRRDRMDGSDHYPLVTTFVWKN